jgi:hypothetical protein
MGVIEMGDIKLDKISDSDLEEELERRRCERNAPPKPVDNPDFTGLRETVISSLKQCVEGEFEDENMVKFIYKKVMKVVYGEKFFEWRDKQDW